MSTMGGPKVYLAGRYSRRAELSAHALELSAHDVVVTSRWLAGSHQAEADDRKAMAHFGTEDLADVLAADVLIAFTEEPRNPSANRGGRHVELGIAIAAGKQVIICGPLENVFCALPQVVRCEAWDNVLSAVLDLRGVRQAA